MWPQVQGERNAWSTIPLRWFLLSLTGWFYLCWDPILARISSLKPALLNTSQGRVCLLPLLAIPVWLILRHNPMMVWTRQGRGRHTQISYTVQTWHSLQNVNLDIGLLCKLWGKTQENQWTSLNAFLFPTDQWVTKSNARTGRKGKRKPSTIYLWSQKYSNWFWEISWF